MSTFVLPCGRCSAIIELDRQGYAHVTTRLGTRYVHLICVKPNDYVYFFYRTTDKGASWESIST